MTDLKAGLPELPERMRSLPVDKRGFPVPWFVGKDETGEWDFRAIRPDGIRIAIRQNTCWLCGQPLPKAKAFCLGPMCTVTRTTSEPPSHIDCAHFAVTACPFLTNPAMRRSPRDLPAGAKQPAGIHIDRNPGVTAVWIAPAFTVFPAPGGFLIRVGDPSKVEWWAKGRKATREEVEASISTGLPLLQAQCASPEDDAELLSMLSRAKAWFPAADYRLAPGVGTAVKPA